MVSEADDNKLIEAILASGVKIPPMPSILTEVMLLERNEDAGPREYAARIADDPATAGALFRVVRSPVLGLRVPVDTLEKAITVLGLKTTLAVVRTEALRNALHDPALEAVMATLWKRMNTVADLTLAMTRSIRPRGVREDLLFQSAVFHDCGVAVLMRRHPTYAHAFADSRWPDLVALDREHQTNHGVIGQMVARSWQLPPEVVLVVRHHHDPHLDELPESVRKMIVLIHFAGHLLDLMAGADEGDWAPVWQERTEEILAQSGHELTEVERELAPEWLGIG